MKIQKSILILSKTGNKFTNGYITNPVFSVLKLFWRKSRKSTKLKQQKYEILKTVFDVLLDKKELFSHFCAGSDIRTNFSNFLILGKSRFFSKIF